MYELSNMGILFTRMMQMLLLLNSQHVIHKTVVTPIIIISLLEASPEYDDESTYTGMYSTLEGKESTLTTNNVYSMVYEGRPSIIANIQSL